MRWKEKTPKRLEERIYKRFLFLPYCVNGEWRWLETGHIRQMYTDTIGWIDICWDN